MCKRVGEDKLARICRDFRILRHCWWKCRMVQLPWKTGWWFLKTLSVESPLWWCCLGLPWWLSGKESTCWCRRLELSPWVEKIPWRRKWQPIPVFLPGKPRDRGAWWAAVHGVTKWSSSSIPRYIPKRIKSIGSYENLYKNVHSSILHNSPKEVTTHVSILWRINTQNVKYLCNGILYSRKKEWSTSKT